MSSSFSKRYSFDCSGSKRVPKSLCSHAGDRVFVVHDSELERSLRSNPRVTEFTIPRDAVTNVPDEIRYDDTVEVELEVDGRPFDNVVDSCSDTVGTLRNGIDGLTGKMGDLNGEVRDLTGGVCKLTGATVAAATGITGAKVASAETIAGSLSRGFSKYIGYLIRERLTELRAKLPNTASTFKALSVNLDKRKSVLGRDYERISERYSKLFVKLNEELRGRLLELDRPAFENCAQMQATIFTNPMGYVLGQSVCAGAEQLQAADAVRVSRLKGTTETAMGVVKDYVKVIRRLSSAVSGVLADRKVEKTRTLAMPVVRMESDDVVTQASGNVRAFMPQFFENGRDMGFGNTLVAAMSATVSRKKSDAEMSIVDGCFKKRFSTWAATSKDGGADSRVTEKILSLWERSKAEMCN